MYKYFALHSDLSHHAFIPVLACVIPTAVLVCLSFGNKTVLVCLSFGNKGVTVATVAKVHLSTPITKQSTQNTPNHHKETGTIPTISFSLKTHFLGTENHATKPRKKPKKKQKKVNLSAETFLSLSLSHKGASSHRTASPGPCYFTLCSHCGPYLHLPTRHSDKGSPTTMTRDWARVMAVLSSLTLDRKP